ncbi:MAG: PIN domain-containing protein [Acidobacteria bacterium]|nr:MAG: PIN domain-containing protein [Acidobacteriota bacterium]
MTARSPAQPGGGIRGPSTANPVVLPITASHLDKTRRLMDLYPSLSARDALHAAVALHSEAAAISSYDRDFDQLAELRRIEP